MSAPTQTHPPVPIDLAPSLFGEGPYSPLQVWAHLVRGAPLEPVIYTPLHVAGWVAMLHSVRRISIHQRGIVPDPSLPRAAAIDGSSIHTEFFPWIFVARARAAEPAWIDPWHVPPRARIAGALAAYLNGSPRVGYFGPPQADGMDPVLVHVEEVSEKLRDYVSAVVHEWWSRHIVAGEVPQASCGRDRAVLGYLHPIGSDDEEVELSEEQERLAHLWTVEKAIATTAAANAERLNAQLRQILGTANMGRGRTCTVYLRSQYRGGYTQRPHTPRVLVVCPTKKKAQAEA